MQDVPYGLHVFGGVDAGAAFSHVAVRVFHGLPEVPSGAQIHVNAIRDVDEAALAGLQPPVAGLFPIHVMEPHPFRHVGQRGAVPQKQASRLRVKVAFALENEVFRAGFQGNDAHVVHDSGEEQAFPFLGGNAEAIG